MYYTAIEKFSSVYYTAIELSGLYETLQLSRSCFLTRASVHSLSSSVLVRLAPGSHCAFNLFVSTFLCEVDAPLQGTADAYFVMVRGERFCC